MEILYYDGKIFWRRWQRRSRERISVLLVYLLEIHFRIFV
jgi:hypothetical protein